MRWVMQSRDFCYWLQGFFELSGDDATISAEQAAMIRRHLDMVVHSDLTFPSRQPQARKPETPGPARPQTPPRSKPAPIPEREAPEPTPLTPPPLC
jgi:hypothetical protein